MATRTIIVDDLDDTSPAVTYYFTYEGLQYEIDLSPEHASEFYDALKPYLDRARPVIELGNVAGMVHPSMLDGTKLSTKTKENSNHEVTTITIKDDDFEVPPAWDGGWTRTPPNASGDTKRAYARLRAAIRKWGERVNAKSKRGPRFDVNSYGHLPFDLVRAFEQAANVPDVFHGYPVTVRELDEVAGYALT